MNKQEFMAVSFPYGLKMFGIAMCEDADSKDHVIEIGSIDFVGCIRNKNRNAIMAIPILHAPSDLVKEIEHNGERFVPLVELGKICFQNSNVSLNGKYAEFSIFWLKFDNGNFSSNGAVSNQLQLYLKLIEWHFDIAGLIENGEAVDVNILETNPYK